MLTRSVKPEYEAHSAANNTTRFRSRIERGGAILGALILTALALLILGGTLRLLSTSIRSVKAQNARSKSFYEAERSFQLALTWLRQNSQKLVSPFTRSKFYGAFDVGPPAAGTNDTSYFSVPTRPKLNRTGRGPILVTDSLLADEAFPPSIDPATGGTFDVAAAFAAGSAGTALVRITLVEALPQRPQGDFGDPDLGHRPPQTDFEPVFRIDAMTGLFEGAHVFGYVKGSLLYNEGFAFYGQNSVEMRKNCDSFESDTGPYGGRNRKPGCSVGSLGLVGIYRNHIVYGSVQTKGSIDSGRNWTGRVCATFEPDCPDQGYICEGSDCQVPALQSPPTWNSLCPRNRGNLRLSRDTTLIAGSADPRDNCWATVTLRAGVVLTLTTTAFPYHFRQVTFGRNASIVITPDTPNQRVTLNILTLPRSVTGEQITNSANKPYQLLLKYNGTRDVALTGPAHHFFLDAPLAPIVIRGNTSIFGGIKAKSLTAEGNGELHYDESNRGGSLPSDMQFTLKSVGQHYR